jgi:hypothetical protein
MMWQRDLLMLAISLKQQSGNMTHAVNFKQDRHKVSLVAWLQKHVLVVSESILQD